MPEYSLRLQPHGAIKGVSALATVRGGYADSRQLEIGDGIPQAGSDPPTLLLYHGIAAWTIDSIDGDGLLCCLPNPTQIG
jgi:hypothetical protein